MRSLLSAAAALAVCCSPAFATDFSQVRCDSPGFVRFIQHKLPSMVSGTTGKGFGQNFSGEKVVRATTTSAAPTKLVCEVTLDLSARGTSRPVNGQFTIQQFPGDRQSWHWRPGY